MNLVWTKHLTDQEEIEKFRDGIKYSWQLDRLYDILTEMKNKEERIEQSTDAYDTPNWDYRQADRNGYNRCLTSIIKLLDQRKSNLIHE